MSDKKQRRIEVKPGDPFYCEDVFEYGGFLEPDGTMKPEDVAKQVVNIGHYCHPLSRLLAKYYEHVSDAGAEQMVFNEAVRFDRADILTDPEADIFLKAWAGNIESAIYLVAAYPESLHFPFVRKAFIKALREMRFAPSARAENMKELFLSLIPARHSGDLPFSDGVLTQIEGIVSQGDGNKLERRERFANSFNVHEKTIRRRAKKGKGQRGRPPRKIK